MKMKVENHPQNDLSYVLFPTLIGECALIMSSSLEIKRVLLPEKDKETLEGKIFSFVNAENEKGSDPTVKQWVKWIQDYFISGHDEEIHKIPIDLNDGFPPFFQLVYQELRKIRAGTIITYGELAKICQRPLGARAVGYAMRKNPLPLLIPCHRVVGAKMKMTGFSAFGGVKIKELLLTRERCL